MSLFYCFSQGFNACLICFQNTENQAVVYIDFFSNQNTNLLKTYSNCE